MIISQERREECRRVVRGYLADRPGIAQSRDTIRRGINHEWDFEDAEVLNALEFLVSLKQLTSQHGSLGATRYYKITAAGTLGHERGE